MLFSRLAYASIVLLASISFAADPPAKEPAPPAKPAENQPAQAAPQNRPQQPAPPNQPQRQGFGFRQQPPPHVVVETVAALADLSLQTDFMITTEQKESIQSLRVDTKTAMDKWRGANHDELQKMAEKR